MAVNSNPPFRADQVGSLLRPAELAEARLKLRAGELSAEQYGTIRDKCIREVVARQEAVGLKGITDGEYSRDWWHIDFLERLDGVKAVLEKPLIGFQGSDEQPPILHVTGKVDRTNPIFTEYFKFLKSVVKQTPKITIPAPAMLYHRGGRTKVSTEVYPDLALMWSDVSAAYKKEIDDYVAAGCKYLQIDDVSFAYLCDPKYRETFEKNGDDPNKLLRTYTNAINQAIAGRPANLTVTTHTCRGNFKNTWAASGGYEPVADLMLNELNVDGYFMEFDSDRAGGFEPLRFFPKNSKKHVVLGLITTKSPVLENVDTVCRRIDEAAKHVPLENLCISTQCGFSSTHHGNSLTQDEQWRKLELVVNIARKVWNY